MIRSCQGGGGRGGGSFIMINAFSSNDQIMPRWWGEGGGGSFIMINAFSSNLNSVKIHLKIKP